MVGEERSGSVWLKVGSATGGVESLFCEECGRGEREGGGEEEEGEEGGEREGEKREKGEEGEEGEKGKRRTERVGAREEERGRTVTGAEEAKWAVKTCEKAGGVVDCGGVGGEAKEVRGECVGEAGEGEGGRPRTGVVFLEQKEYNPSGRERGRRLEGEGTTEEE
jgi:hypothetical protein